MFQQPGDDGVEVEERRIHGIPVTAVEIKTEDGAESLDRAVGKYITIQTGLLSSETLDLKALGECVSEVLAEVLSRYKGNTLCICGLGNRELVADSLGPDVIRNLSLKVFSGVASLNGLFKSVCSFVPGTAWTNNLDTELMVKGILKEANANCLLLIDSLVTRNPERLRQSIQVSTAGGMNPFFAGRSIDWSSLGVPVISVGVPLAITAGTFIQSGVLTEETFTTLNAHHAVAASSFIISYAILRTCWPDLTTQDCIDFIRFNRDVIPYRTARELYYDKIGVEPVIAPADKSITFAIGHLLEDIVAQVFSKQTGLTVYRDQTMYQHPLFPFMLADVDRFVTLPNGEKAILECKTAHFSAQCLWANGCVPRHYELQVRHYMSVMNINTAYIACLFSNNEDDFVWQKIERDLDEEENTISLLEEFWTQYVCRRQEPPLVGKPDVVLDVIRRYHGPADKSIPEVAVGKEYAQQLDQIIELREEKSSLERRARQLGKQIKVAYAPILDLMGAACNAVCETPTASYQISYNPQYQEEMTKAQLELLRAQHPDIYHDFVDTTEKRVFKISKEVK